jgi:outer membrane lipoprotein-sorting protein
MKRGHYLILALLLCTQGVRAQQPTQLISAVYKNFLRLRDYSADVKMDFDIPSVNMKSIQGKVFFKQPNKFRVRTSGIVFMPKQNPYFALTFLADTTAYTAVETGQEKIDGIVCRVITTLPLKEGDIILAKFWIDAQRMIVLRTQLTTHTNGMIQMDNSYGKQTVYPLPDKTLFTVDMTKFKVPKAVSIELNAKPTTNVTTYNQKGIGYITLAFSGYKINQKLPDTVFTEEATKQ